MTVLKSAIGFEPIYTSWRKMHERCSSPNSEKYPTYGAVGISVCPEWSTFPQFLGWSLNNGWAPGLSIDRIDNEVGYYPGNCRWATPREQTINRRNVPKNENGEAYCDVAVRNGIKIHTFQARLARGWTIDRASTELPGPALGRHSHGAPIKDAGKVMLEIAK